MNRLANALLALGVGRGDAVGLFLPMSVQVVVGFYAIAKIGAIVVPIFSGFAAPAVAARLADAGAVALLTADAVPRRGRPVSMKAIADEAVAAAPSVRAVVVWSRLGTDPPMRPGRDHGWDELVAAQSPVLARTRARPGDADDGDLHVGHDRAAEGRRARPRRVPGEDRRGVRLPARRRHGRPLHVGHRHGLDHGAARGGRRGRARSDARDRRGRARLSRPRPPLGHGRAPPHHHPRRLADADPGAAPARRRAGRRATTARRCGSSARPASRGTPTRTGGCTRSAARAGRRSSTSPAAPRSARASSRRCRSCRSRRARSARRRSAWRWTSSDADGEHLPPGSVGELVCRKPWPSMTRGRLGRPGALPADVLVAVAGRLGARRLGLGRRRRLLVPARPLRRHAQHRRQAHRAGRVRVGRRLPPPPSPRHARWAMPDPVKGEVAWLYCVLRPGFEPGDELRAEVRGAVTDRARQGVRAGPYRLRHGAPQDALGQDRAPRRAGRRARRRPRRHVVHRGPGRARPGERRQVSRGPVLGSLAVDAGRVT